MGRTLSGRDRELFLDIMLPDIKGKASEEIKGRLLYAFKTGKLTDSDLASSFTEDFNKLTDFLETKPRFTLFTKPNYVFEYIFGIHNADDKTKVVPAKIVGFKAERAGKTQLMTARVRYHDGTAEESSLRVFEGVEIKDINLHKKVLVHNGTVCLVISDKDYAGIIRDYFSGRKV